MRFVLAVVLVMGCGDDASVTDGGSDGARPDDSGVRDTSVDTSAPPVDVPRADGGGPATGLMWEDCEGGGRMLTAGPDDYRSVLDTLEPGDTLQLSAGTYQRGLPISISGEEGRCIVIEGAPGARPLLVGSDSFNIIAFRGSSWIKVRGLDIDGMGLAGFGVASQGADVPVHHIVIEDLEMTGLAGNQQIVGISTKTPAWDWVIRGNRILEAGTGLYLGNSDGRQPFIRGLIEYNVVVNTLGYNMQIKHQIVAGRGDLGLADMPDDATTIIRYNVFTKAERARGGGDARPNLLLGHFPASGSGQDDQYSVYGNFFYENPTEMLFQGEGNVALYSNVLVNTVGGGINIRPHNGTPDRIDVFQNTVVTRDRGISVTGGNPSFAQSVLSNVAFAGMPIRGDTAADNIEGDFESADTVLINPAGSVGVDLSLRPRDAASVMGTSPMSTFPDAQLDFDRTLRGESARGAYDPAGTGWQLAIEIR